MLFDQLSLVWQVWGYMLLGAILMGCGLLVGIEWAWLSFCARAAWATVRGWAVRTFTAAGDDPYPQTVETIARAKAARQRELRDADQILIDSRGHAYGFRSCDTPAFPFEPIAPHADDTLRRRQLLALAETSPAVSRKVH